MNKTNIEVTSDEIVKFCHRHHIRKLAFFGSVLSSDFRPDSDVDVLVEFETGHVPGLFKLAEMKREFSSMLSNREVDLCTPQDLSHYFREEVIASAKVQYEQN
jgi:hypothetical protein